jgi:signal transduction histidine kinase
VRTGEEVHLDATRARSDRRRVAIPIGLAVLVGAVPTLLIAAVEDLRFVYEGAQLRSALDTAQALIGALVAYLLYGRFRRTGLLNDLALAYALGLAAATNLTLAAVPAIVGDLQPDAFTTWAPLTARTVTASVIALAALGPDRPYRWSRPPGPALVTAILGTVGAVSITVGLLADRLPAGVERALTASASGRPRLESEPVLLVAQVVLMGCFIGAAIGFARRALTDRSTLTLALAVACVLSAFARLNFVLYPSLYTDIVHTGDVFRLAFYLVLLVGAAGEINRYWLAQTQAVAAAERRRVARDLHDGLTQELSFIRSHTASLAEGRSDPQVLEHVAAAAQRALTQSRRVIEALTFSALPDLRDAVTAAIDGLASAYGATVDLDVAEVRADPETAATAAWIARESVSNALRHGGATRVTVAVHRDGATLRLTVEDDGFGFAPGEPGSAEGRQGFGLRSMRERAELLGGELRVTSAPGAGTSLEAVLPISR